MSSVEYAPAFSPRAFNANDITDATLERKAFELKKTNPRQYRRRKEITRGYEHGDFDVAWAMDTERLTKRKATKQIAEQRAAQRLYDADPAEAEFVANLPDWRNDFQKGIRSGNIFFDDMLASPTPLYGFEMKPEQWSRFQAMLPEMVPWQTPAQKPAFDRYFCEVQRAYATTLFASLTVQGRREHHDTWWHSEVPPPNWPGWNEGVQKWRVLRAELMRQIARDQERGNV